VGGGRGRGLRLQNIYRKEKKKKIRFLRLLMPYNIKNSTAVEKPILSSTDLE